MRTKGDFLIFGSPCIGQEEIDEVVASMKSGWIGTGPKTAQFENDFALYKEAAYAVAVNSGTAALHLAMLVAGIGPGDEVITTALTFCATINTIIHAGATPVLADVDPVSMNIDPIEVEAKITSRTKAILPVHFAGRPCDMDRLCAIASRHKLLIIEDCAHAIETEYKGRKAGLFGDVGCFSFYVTKNIVTGEGGMILTGNENFAARAKTLALHGMSADAWSRFSDSEYKHYKVTGAGFKYNMMDIQAAIGMHQLRRVDQWWERRKEIWAKYNKAFAELPVELPAAPEPETRHAYHLYTMLIDKEKTGISRDDFLRAMHKQNIGVGVHYLSIPEHPFYQERFGWHAADYPIAMRIGQQTVSIPLSPKLTDVDVFDVIEAVTDLVGTPTTE
ncbi:MAG: DegT/DnrJ/EryC1/StrS family aminotransferase [Bacteroidia bacterium]|nr:DegT/DnrJ/EryC1/StrS family aminotransferase [Bacteroidia bacterium]